MKKRMVTLASAFALLIALSIPAFAVQPRLPVVAPSLHIEDNIAYCTVTLTSAGDEIDVTMSLWRNNTHVSTWSDSDTSYVFISEKCRVMSNNTYTLKINGSINGVAFDETTISATS